MKKILLVDDSLVYRNAVKNALLKHCQQCDIHLAKNGQEALDIIKEGVHHFDLIVLDIEMPVLDGVETTRSIRIIDKKVPIIVFAAPTQVGAKKAMDALGLGANDFVKKFDLSVKESDLIQSELIPKIMSIVEVEKHHQVAKPQSETRVQSSSILERLRKCELICIGSSTGGPDAVRKIFANIKGPLRVPVMMVQHMPPVFTKQFSLMLSKISGLGVHEAENSMTLEKGNFYIAPGDYHMTLDGKSIKLNQEEKVCYVRPSYDVLIRSLSHFNRPICYIVLTGMGDDGAEAILANKKRDDIVIIQNKESCVVWGMPGAIHARNLHDVDSTLEEISTYINSFKAR
jgi:two-component system, chemotaxis family, protein-glutamate methylesterase/glutaminase